MVARGNLRLKALSAKLQAQADVTSNAVQVMSGTVLHVSRILPAVQNSSEKSAPVRQAVTMHHLQ